MTTLYLYAHFVINDAMQRHNVDSRKDYLKNRLHIPRILTVLMRRPRSSQHCMLKILTNGLSMLHLSDFSYILSMSYFGIAISSLQLFSFS
jgi:hypothetical protein